MWRKLGRSVNSWLRNSKAPAAFTRRLQDLSNTYARLSVDYPFAISSLSGGSILFCSDLTAQFVVSRRSELDDRRLLAVSSFGFFYYGFIMKAIYIGYDLVLGPKRAVVKTILDCVVHTPFGVIPAFYFLTGVIKGQTTEQWTTQLRKEWFDASFGSVAYWTPVQIICFRYIPQHSRIAFVSFASFFHKIWLSWLSCRNRTKHST